MRPTLDDVERISRGQAAKRRGTGSRGVAHRLNEAERVEWDLVQITLFIYTVYSFYCNDEGEKKEVFVTSWLWMEKRAR